MTDIAKRKRTFVVYLDRQVVGCDASEEEVTVEAGEDADVVCNDVLQEMLGNELDAGWYEKKRGGK